MSMSTMHTEFAARLQMWGLTLPSAAADACETWTVATNLVTANPEGALRQAALDGEVNASNVQDAIERAALSTVASEHARTLVNTLDFPLSQRFHAAISAAGDDIVEGLTGAFETHVTALERAAAVIPSDATADTVLFLGPDAVQAWHGLQQAGSALDQLADVRMTLARQYGYGHNGPPVAAFLAGVTDDAALAHADRTYRGLDGVYHLEPVRGGPWRHLLDAGFRMRLNTRAEADAVTAIKPLSTVG